MMRRRQSDGSEMVSWVILIPVMLSFLIGILSLNYGAFQRALIEYGASNIGNSLGPEIAASGLTQAQLDAAVLDAICASSPLLAADTGNLTVENTRVTVADYQNNSRFKSTTPDWFSQSPTSVGTGRDAWGADGDSPRTVGHTDSEQIRIQTDVTYHLPPLIGSQYFNGTGNADYRIHIDRTYILTRREEVS